MPIPFQNAMFDNLTPKPVSSVVTRGSLITFNYIFHKPGHDPQPLVLITDVNYTTKNSPQVYVRGCNLHYLTFPVIKKLLFPSPGHSVCDQPSITYQYIKNDQFIKSSFRQYKRNGIENLKKMDCNFIVKALSLSRSFDPNEIDAIRKSIRDQISQMINPQATGSSELAMP